MHRRVKRKFVGQVLLLAVVLLAVVFGLSGAFISYVTSVQKSSSVFSARSAARQAAFSGIDKAIWCLNQSSGTNCGGTYGTGFTGETAVSVASSTYYTTTITSVDGNHKTVTSTGYYPSTTNPVGTVVLKADTSINTTTASFHYGVQAGRGGFTLSNNAYVVGNIYANADVVGGSGSYCTGTVWVAGGTALTPDQQDTVNNSDYAFAQTSTNPDIAQSFQLSASNVINKVSFYMKKTGTPSNSTVRILADNGGVPSKTAIASGTLNASNVTTSYGWVDVSFASPPALADGVTYWISIDGTANASNYWWIGSDTGDTYADGTGMYSTNWNASNPVWSSAGRDVDFKVYTGGNTTKIDGLHVEGSAYANTLTNDTVDGDAYYQTKTSTTVGGTSHPGSADPGPQDMPISDSQIDEWKTEAAAGGTTAGDVSVSGSQTLGPRKITGNLSLSNNSTLTVAGTLWIQGNLSLSNNVTIGLASGYGANSGTIIVDGKVSISNNSTFQGSGTSGSYVLVLTTNGSLDTNSPAMSLSNNSANSIFYASNGVVTIANNASIKEVTGFALSLSNNASVQYESGLQNVSFSSGPGGSWVLTTGTVREIR